MLHTDNHIVSSVLPFPNVYWWSRVIQASSVTFDYAEHFEKRSFRNRYYVATAHGAQCLSIPLEKGRGQRSPMGAVQLSYAENWQQQHWRTLYSAYNRSPYFEYYKDSLEVIFQTKYLRLVDFNLATIHWLRKHLAIDFEEHATQEYIRTPTIGTDLRPMEIKHPSFTEELKYYQVFHSLHGFLPNLSILDLLFNEGRQAVPYLNRLCRLG